nr:myo-inositol 2-dehydrogenase [Candidatus Pantoea persica]
MAHYLVGDIEKVKRRYDDGNQNPSRRPGPQPPVENEDQASELLRFQNGAHGVIETSPIVVTGTKGTLRYTRMAELALYLYEDPAGRQGFKTILTGPAHPDYASFCVSAGHGIIQRFPRRLLHERSRRASGCRRRTTRPCSARTQLFQRSRSCSRLSAVTAFLWQV